MSGKGDSSLSRFRANLEARVKNLLSLLEVLEYLPSDPEAIRQVQGELHTFKGEARLLGLVALSELAHALEGMVGQEGGTDFAKVSGALHAMRDALEGAVDAKAVDARIRRSARELLALELAPLEAAEASTEAEPTPEAPRGARAAEPRWVQVDAGQIDLLCERMGELAATFGRLQSEVRALTKDQSQHGRAALAASMLACRGKLDDVVDRAWGLRLAPIEPMLRQLEQHARLLAKRAHKNLEVRVEAGPVRLERDVVDQVWDSLLHLVQNAVAHGIPRGDESDDARPGTLTLSAASSGGGVLISVEDDGDGIDPDRVRDAALARGIVGETEARSMSDHDAVLLLFRPGFSTKDDVSQLSGRGIGLDVVKAKIEALGGSVAIHSARGKGTRVVLTVPHAITKERILVVEVDGALHGIPCRLIRGVLGQRELGEDPDETTVVRFAERPIPVRSMSKALGSKRDAVEPVALVVQLGDKSFAARVSQIVAERDLLRRPADPLLSNAFGIGGSAHLDDGRLVLLLDFGYLERLLERPHERSAPLEKGGPQSTVRSRVLIVDDSPVVTSLVSELLTSVGLLVEVAHDGRQAIQALDRELPNLVLSDVEMPNMGGFELLSAIRDRSAELPVVMLTTRGSIEDRQRASTLGANAYVLKSGFQNDVLLDVVGRFVPVAR